MYVCTQKCDYMHCSLAQNSDEKKIFPVIIIAYVDLKFPTVRSEVN